MCITDCANALSDYCALAQSDQRLCYFYLKSKVTRSDISLISIFGGLHHDKVSGYARGRTMPNCLVTYHEGIER